MADVVADEGASCDRVAQPGGRRAVAWARYACGQVALAACLTAAAMLAAQHLGRWSLPGCGPASPCAQLAASRWGSIRGWPVAFLGTAWFAALWLCYAWTAWRGAVPELFRWGVRAGAAGSLFFLGVMVLAHHFCPYCLAVHAGNLVFWLLVESAPVLAPSLFFRPALAGAAVFVGVSVFFGIADAASRRTAADRAEAEFRQSLDQIVAKIRLEKKVSDAKVSGTLSSDVATGSAERKVPDTFPDADTLSPDTLSHALQGRWRRGPDRAAIRLVIFGDYQCPTCGKIDGPIRAAADERPDVAILFKHYPLCRDCNRQIQAAPMHQHACRAALAVEAAGIVKGAEGWWRMHDWLFARAGQFSDAELREALPRLELGDPQVFFAVMQGPQALGRVKQDIEDAIALGIDATPVVFLNGMELAHPEVADGISRAIDAVAREQPEPRSGADDRPQSGLERLTAAWLAARKLDLSGHTGHWSLGPASARHRLVLGICHACEYSPRFSRAARELVARRSDVRIEFWHFPLSKRWNSAYANSRNNDYPRAFRMALVAEAAGQLGGNDAFWKMHDWLLDHRTGFSEEAARRAAAGFGLDTAKFAEKIASKAVREGVKQDIAAAATAGFQAAPCIFLGERLVPGPEPTPELMDRILAEMDRLGIP